MFIQSSALFGMSRIPVSVMRLRIRYQLLGRQYSSLVYANWAILAPYHTSSRDPSLLSREGEEGETGGCGWGNVLYLGKADAGRAERI